MKNTLRATLCLLLAALLALGCAAFAEPEAAVSNDITRLEALINGKVYTFATTIDGLREQGINFSQESPAPGYWYTVDTGRVALDVLIDAASRDTATADDLYVCGYDLSADKAPQAVIYGGLTVGEMTPASVVAALGEPNYGAGTSSLTYNFRRNYISMYFYFDGEGEDAPLRHVRLTSSIPYAFGLEVSELAGVEDDNLPDPKLFNFNQFILDGKYFDGSKLKVSDLIEKGWRVDARDAKKVLEAQSGNSVLISGDIIYLYNGVGMVQAFVWNIDEDGTGAECTLPEADVLYVGANVADRTSLIVADGLTFGSTLEEVQRTFGTNSKADVNDTYTYYEYTMNGVRNGFSAGEDGVVFYVRVQP